jgi:hypothetical protein
LPLIALIAPIAPIAADCCMSHDYRLEHFEGPSGLSRLSSDVLHQTGVKGMPLLEGSMLRVA